LKFGLFSNKISKGYLILSKAASKMLGEIFPGTKKAEEDSARLGCGFIFSKASNHSLTVGPICQGRNLFFSSPLILSSKLVPKITHGVTRRVSAPVGTPFIKSRHDQ